MTCLGSRVPGNPVFFLFFGIPVAHVSIESPLAAAAAIANAI